MPCPYNSTLWPVPVGARHAPPLQFAAEGAMLQRGEQGVELGEVGAVLGFELVDFGGSRGEDALEIERSNRDCDSLEQRLF